MLATKPCVNETDPYINFELQISFCVCHYVSIITYAPARLSPRSSPWLFFLFANTKNLITKINTTKKAINGIIITHYFLITVRKMVPFTKYVYQLALPFRSQ